MRQIFARGAWWRLCTLLSGCAVVFGSCDPTTRAAFEDGVINLSTSFVGSFIQAAIQAWAASQTT